MPMQADYLINWIDTSIHEFLHETIPPASMAYALITCLDSNFKVSAMLHESRYLQKIKKECKVVGDALLLPTRTLLKADETDRLFYGFDEVWFFPTSIVAEKPSAFIITGPGRIVAPDIEHYREWLHTSRCSLGIGDGTGMNICVKVRGMPRPVVAALNASNSCEFSERQPIAAASAP